MPRFTIEIANKQNRQAIFRPLNERLRGEWANWNINGKTMHSSVQLLPGPIPGIRLSVDTDQRTLRRYDPLGEDEHKDLWQKLQSHLKANDDHLKQGNPWPEVLIENADPTQIKTWLYWFRRMVDSGTARVVETDSASLPPMETIMDLPGLTEVGQLNTNSHSPKYKEHFAPGDIRLPDSRIEEINARQLRPATPQAVASAGGQGSFGGLPASQQGNSGGPQ